MDAPTMKKHIQLTALIAMNNQVHTDEYIAAVLGIAIDPHKGISDSNRVRFRKVLQSMVNKARETVLFA
jgi:hypothetical protein